MYMERQWCIILSKEASIEKEWTCYTEFMRLKGPILGAALIASKSYPMRVHTRLPKDHKVPHPQCLEIKLSKEKEKEGYASEQRLSITEQDHDMDAVGEINDCWSDLMSAFGDAS